MLNPDDHIDLYILHYVFLPIIQQQLDVFRAAWACHALRTERNRTPHQLWVLGLHEANLQDQSQEAVSGIDVVSSYVKLHYRRVNKATLMSHSSILYMGYGQLLNWVIHSIVLLR